MADEDPGHDAPAPNVRRRRAIAGLFALSLLVGAVGFAAVSRHNTDERTTRWCNAVEELDKINDPTRPPQGHGRQLRIDDLQSALSDAPTELLRDPGHLERTCGLKLRTPTDNQAAMRDELALPPSTPDLTAFCRLARERPDVPRLGTSGVPFEQQLATLDNFVSHRGRLLAVAPPGAPVDQLNVQRVALGGMAHAMRRAGTADLQRVAAAQTDEERRAMSAIGTDDPMRSLDGWLGKNCPP